MKFLRILACLLCLHLVSAQAFIVAQLGKAELVSDKETHIIAAGVPKKLQELFQQAAIEKGRKYLALHPTHQVFFIFEQWGELPENLNWLAKQNVTVVSSSPYDLFIEDFLQYAKGFSKIASLDFFTHSGAFAGVVLSSTYDGAIKPSTKKIEQLKPSLLPNAFVALHGCNSGFFTAPALSQLLGVAVFGSLTSTDFQEQYVDGNWYSNNLEQRPDLKKVGGLRMKPDNVPYKGVFGAYEAGGLGFYKAFCKDVPRQKCLQGMAHFALSFISNIKLNGASDLSNYKALVKDMLCPIGKTAEIRTACVKELDKSVLSPDYSPYRGKQLQCDFQGCQFEFCCTTNDQCSLQNTAGGKVTTFIDEYQNYLEAFPFL